MYAYRAPPQPAAPAVRLVPLVTAQDRAVFGSPEEHKRHLLEQLQTEGASA